MESTEFQPLGFSDLTEDESFIISIYRDWRRHWPASVLAERRLTERLRNDCLYDGLEPLFQLFRMYCQKEVFPQENNSALLSMAEETLLNEIGSKAVEKETSVEQFQTVLKSANVNIRPASAIPRSGHDRLAELVGHHATVVMQTLHPLPR
ncbi:MAG: hypothetical protein AAGA53_04925 [Pseudomonadota bacterium]